MKTKEIVISVVVIVSLIFTGYGAYQGYKAATKIRDAQIAKLESIK